MSLYFATDILTILKRDKQQYGRVSEEDLWGVWSPVQVLA